MSEKQPAHHNQRPHHEKLVGHEHQQRVHEHLAKEAETARRQKSAENIEKIKQLAEAEAKKSEKISAHENQKQESDSGFGMQQHIKLEAFNRLLARTQQKLSKPVRGFSRFTHSPLVDKVSNVSAQTIARPSGILGGSICAFAGSLIVYYFAKHYGFEYNYLFVFLLFIGGYAVGAFLELAIWLVYSRRQRYKV